MICNYVWPNHCLNKWGLGDEETGTYKNQRLSWHPKDTWKIIPLFSKGNIRWNRLSPIDNRLNSQPIKRESKFSKDFSATDESWGESVF